jgi:hypothetical protein
MGSGVMLYVPSVIKIGYGIEKLFEVIHRHRTAYFYFFRIGKVG